MSKLLRFSGTLGQYLPWPSGVRLMMFSSPSPSRLSIASTFCLRDVTVLATAPATDPPTSMRAPGSRVLALNSQNGPTSPALAKIDGLLEKWGTLYPDDRKQGGAGAAAAKTTASTPAAASTSADSATQAPTSHPQQSKVAASEIMKEIQGILKSNGDGASPQKLVRIVGMLRRMQRAHPPAQFAATATPLYTSLLAAAVSPQGSMQRAELVSWSMLLHGTAAMQALAPEAMQKLLVAAITCFASKGTKAWVDRHPQHGVKPVTVSLTLWAFATCGYKGDLTPLIQGINASLDSGVMRPAVASEWCNAIWGAAKLGIPHQEMKPLWDRASPALGVAFRLKRSNPQDVAMAFYAVAKTEYKLGYRHLIAGSVHAGAGLFHNAQAEVSATVLWALSQMMPEVKKDDDHWVDACRLRATAVTSLTQNIKYLKTPKAPMQPLITSVTALGALGAFESRLFNTAVRRQQLALDGMRAEGKGATLAQVVDSVCILLGCAQTYPGLAVTMELRLQNRAWVGQGSDISQLPADGWLPPPPAMLSAAPASAAASGGSSVAAAAQQLDADADPAFSAATAAEDGSDDEDGYDEEEKEGEGGSLGADVLVLQLMQLRAWLHEVRVLLCSVDVSRVTEWEDQSLCNLLWAWSMLLPPAPLPQGAPTQPAPVSTSPAPAATPQAAPGQQQQQQQQSVAYGQDCKEPFLAVGAALFAECGRRVQSGAFTKAGQTQLYSAHMEARERGLPGLPEGQVLAAARAEWQRYTQQPEKSNISRSQAEVAQCLRHLGYQVQEEVQTDAKGLVEGQGPAGKGGAAAQQVTLAAGQVTLEPLLVDMMVTQTPDHRPCRVAIEFDGPHHFLFEPRWGYTGVAALRHVQLRRRVDHLMVITHKQWKKLKPKAKTAPQMGAKINYIQELMEGVSGIPETNRRDPKPTIATHSSTAGNSTARRGAPRSYESRGSNSGPRSSPGRGPEGRGGADRSGGEEVWRDRTGWHSSSDGPFRVGQEGRDGSEQRDSGRWSEREGGGRGSSPSSQGQEGRDGSERRDNGRWGEREGGGRGSGSFRQGQEGRGSGGGRGGRGGGRDSPGWLGRGAAAEASGNRCSGSHRSNSNSRTMATPWYFTFLDG